MDIQKHLILSHDIVMCPLNINVCRQVSIETTVGSIVDKQVIHHSLIWYLSLSVITKAPYLFWGITNT